MSSPVSLDMILCRGGLDQITPTLSLANSYCRYSLNFEAAVTGGYTRVVGYERFDGNKSPTAESSRAPNYILVGMPTGPIPSVGDHVVSSSGGTGIINALYSVTPTVTDVAWVVELTSTTGVWTSGNGFDEASLLYSGIVLLSYGNASTPEEAAQNEAALADVLRTNIEAVPGSGPVRGVVEFNDIVYAFRDEDNPTPAVCNIYKSSSTGWVNVPFYQMVEFTDGLDEPADGDTLTQAGPVTALIKRVVRTGGSWQGGDAVGYLVIDTVTGGPFVAAAATAGTSTTLNLTGAETDITLLPGGRYEFEEHNFAGQEVTTRVYGCDGVNKMFEFDGDVLVPISTGAATDTPTHLVAHKGYLFASLGSSILHSAPGLPYDWTALSGAAELPTGAVATGMISMPGGTSQATLGVFNRSNTSILYGSSPADWNLVSYNTGTGAIPYSLQNMAQTFAFDDRGVNSITTALQYGNFDSTTLTSQVLPFINSKVNLLTATTLCRRKSQYRLFFSDGFALYITVVNGKAMGSMPVYFPHPVACAYEGKKSTGEDVMYFGSTDGFVYQMERGTSFDGDEIPFNLTMNYSNAKSPRTLKRYRKCVPEIHADAGTFAKFYLGYLLGYDSDSYAQPGETDYSKYTGSSRWDSFVWDAFFWDTKPTDFLECSLDGTAENIALAIDGSYNYIPSFTINSFIVHFTPRRLMR